jgi:hypothetical protein
MVVAGRGPDGNLTTVELGRREMDLNYDWGSSSLLYGDQLSLRTFIKQKKEEQSHPQFEQADGPSVTLTDSQNQVNTY